MKHATLILGALVLLAQIGSANAGSAGLPKDILGDWCGSTGTANIGWSYRYPGQRCEEDTIIFQPRQYIAGEESWEHACTYTAVKTRFDKSIIATTKTMGVTVAAITANCSDGPCRWQERVTVYLSKGGLFMKDHKFSTQKCRDQGSPQ